MACAGDAMSEWLPIESAPMDGRSVLLFQKNRTDAGYSIVQASCYEGRFYADSRECVIDWEDGITKATHWMPLPEPPK
jgi:hypothetical protein